MTAIDMIARRVRLAFLNVQAAQEALPEIICIMAEELNWSEGKFHFTSNNLTQTNFQTFRGATRTNETGNGILTERNGPERKQSEQGQDPDQPQQRGDPIVHQTLPDHRQGQERIRFH